MENTTQYHLQLRVVSVEGSPDGSHLEVLAHPIHTGEIAQGCFAQWEPVFESICSWMSSSAFHRKAIQRTLIAGLPAHLINRETGSKHAFSSEQIAQLRLTPQAGDDTVFSTAA